MRIHSASASASVTRSLALLIPLSGHEPSDAANAELIIADHLHPVTYPLPADIPQLSLAASAGESTLADGLACPFRPQQLVQLLRGWRLSRQLPLGNGWMLNFMARSLVHPTQPSITLTEKEASLLAALATAAPSSITREELLSEVWGITHEIDTHTLETHIYRLRHKLAEFSPPPGELMTEGGTYKFVPAAG